MSMIGKKIWGMSAKEHDGQILEHNTHKPRYG